MFSFTQEAQVFTQALLTSDTYSDCLFALCGLSSSVWAQPLPQSVDETLRQCLPTFTSVGTSLLSLDLMFVSAQGL